MSCFPEGRKERGGGEEQEVLRMWSGGEGKSFLGLVYVTARPALGEELLPFKDVKTDVSFSLTYQLSKKKLFLPWIT